MEHIIFFKDYLNELDLNNLVFKDHFFERVAERPIYSELVKEILKKEDALLSVDKIAESNKYKAIFKLSNKRNLVLIVSILEDKLYIITGWVTNIKWQKKIQ